MGTVHGDYCIQSIDIRDGMHRVESVITGVTIPCDDMGRPLDTSLLSQRDRGICKCIMLIVAHASLIGKESYYQKEENEGMLNREAREYDSYK